MRIRVKICGVTNEQGLEAAVTAGADSIGFVLADSPRQVSLQRAAYLSLRLPPGVTPVLVLRYPDPAHARRAVEEVPAAVLQVELTPEVALALPDWARLAPVVHDQAEPLPAAARALGLAGARAATLHFEGAGPGGRGAAPDRERARQLALRHRLVLAGGLRADNVAAAIREVRPFGVDVSSGVERTRGMRFGRFGGCYVPETLTTALRRLSLEAREALADAEFRGQLERELATWAGRPTPLTHAPNLSRRWGAEIWLKREDLAHTGAHKINNALGQVLLAGRTGARRIVAETGAGQHGVATAAAAARAGLPCTVYMGEVDTRRQAPNVRRMQLFGAAVVPVTSGDRTLRAAINEAIRDWVSDPANTHYVIGSVVGPQPYPWLVRELQSVIGQEARRQIHEHTGALPDSVIACVGGGSNAIGMFHAFRNDPVALHGIEAGGRGDAPGEHAATIARGSPGVLHGCFSLLLQDADGQVLATHSISAGLDYPGVGPEHAMLHEQGRAVYSTASDEAAVAALMECSEAEGILPALESAHALAGARMLAAREPGSSILVCLSGRGDKDLELIP